MLICLLSEILCEFFWRPLGDLIVMICSQSRIDMLKKDDGALVFKLRDPGSLHRIKGAEPEEQVSGLFTLAGS